LKVFNILKKLNVLFISLTINYMSKPKILITNDDGIDSPGIYTLVQTMKEFGDIVVIAPDRQQSAVGHALTVANPLRAIHFHRNGEMFGYAINGTPSDCVKIAISTLLEQKPDMIISGINHGQNTAINVLYSGTVSAATEGILLGIPSIAVSLATYDYGADCSVAANYALQIARSIKELNLPKGVLLNINVPSLETNEIKGIKITRVSRNIWNDRYEKRIDPYGRAYYWFAGELSSGDDDPESDYVALKNGWVSVTPIEYSFTNHSIIKNLKVLEV
jgi:5'-nucleotidase